MRVAVDALAATTGGGVTYLRSLLGSALAADPELEFVLICAEAEPFAALLADARVEAVAPLGLSPSLPRRLAWELGPLGRAARSLGGDVLFSPSEIAPLRPSVPLVLGLQNPNLYERPVPYASPLQEVRLRVLARLARASARRAAVLVFVSEPFRRRATARLGSLRAQQYVVEPGLDPVFAAPPTNGRSFDDLRPYVLSVSDFYPYKNIPLLVDAFARLARPGLRLVLAGRAVDRHSFRETLRRVREARVGERVTVLGAVPLEAMPALYTGAECFVFPSLLESFGFPPLEALACGVPVACARSSVMPELLGDTVLWFEGTDADDAARAMAALLDDSDAARAALERGRRQAVATGWVEAGARLVSAFAAARREVR